MKNFLILFFALSFIFLTSCSSTSPLIKASYKGDTFAIQKLLNEGASINEADDNGCTPLMHAIWSGKTEAAKTLISKGADVNAKDKSGYTPLLWAVSYENLDVAKLLIDKGADINAKSNDESTPYALAVASNNHELENLLKQKGAKANAKNKLLNDALFSAVQNKQPEIVKSLIAKGADIETKDSFGMTPLVYAAYYYLPYAQTKSKFSAIKRVIKSEKNEGNQDLEKTVEVIKLLLQSGANINVKSPEGTTILDIALCCSQWDVVSEVIKTGFNLWNPETGKSRIIFISSDLYDYVKVTVGDKSKSLNQNPGVGAAFFDVAPGKYVIDANQDKYVSKNRASIDVNEGQTYYFKVTQNMRNRIIGYSILVPSSLVDSITSTNSFPITTMTEADAKQQLNMLLKLPKSSEEKISQSSASASNEISKSAPQSITKTEFKQNNESPSKHAQKLRELKKLKDEGLLTDKEYEEKRKTVIDGI